MTTSEVETDRESGRVHARWWVYAIAIIGGFLVGLYGLPWVLVPAK